MPNLKDRSGEAQETEVLRSVAAFFGAPQGRGPYCDQGAERTDRPGATPWNFRYRRSVSCRLAKPEKASFDQREDLGRRPQKSGRTARARRGLVGRHKRLR